MNEYENSSRKEEERNKHNEVEGKERRVPTEDP